MTDRMNDLYCKGRRILDLLEKQRRRDLAGPYRRWSANRCAQKEGVLVTERET